MQPEEYADFRRKADERMEKILSEARAAFDRDMETVEGYQRRSEYLKAKGHLKNMIETYGLPNLVREAQDALDEMG